MYKAIIYQRLEFFVVVVVGHKCEMNWQTNPRGGAADVERAYVCVCVHAIWSKYTEIACTSVY